MDFLLSNWTYILLGFYVLEKIVKLTPVKWDDILVDGIRSILKKLVGKSGNTPDTPDTPDDI